MNPLDTAIELLGGVSELALAAGVPQSTISMAKSRRSVSPQLAERIERATEGRVSRESLVWPNKDKAA